MKEYAKEYENVLTGDRVKKRLDLDKVEVLSGMPFDEYIRLSKEMFSQYQTEVFDKWVKFYWVMMNFAYNGNKRKSMMPASKYLDGATSIFLRNSLNFDRKLFTHSMYFNKVCTYFVDFFPELLQGNPFETKYEYPYKYMTFDCLFLVYQMPERIELLNLGEVRKMTYPEFVDYIFNHILCHNEECGTSDYTAQYPNDHFPPYIKYENYVRNRKPKRRKHKT